MADRIRLGILGGGRIVQRRILPAMQYVQEAELVAIASQRRGVAQELANGFPVSKSLESYEDLLKDPDIDAVYIPASGDAHHRWTVAAAEAGKHVLCEKPLAPTLQEAEEMVRVCEDANVILHEAFMWRHHPRALKLRELVQSGQIGELRLVNVSFSFDIDRSDWRLDPARGG
ncbi:MAG: Gfo/Idh/MocA family oxidoreductase, partial [Planctomycetaceae bacterium]|nr:Gfo/Idh/MocA family oxidoreductase [Planctomycetaceae bacterium]